MENLRVDIYRPFYFIIIGSENLSNLNKKLPNYYGMGRLIWVWDSIFRGNGQKGNLLHCIKNETK